MLQQAPTPRAQRPGRLTSPALIGERRQRGLGPGHIRAVQQQLCARLDPLLL